VAEDRPDPPADGPADGCPGPAGSDWDRSDRAGCDRAAGVGAARAACHRATTSSAFASLSGTEGPTGTRTHSAIPRFSSATTLRTAPSEASPRTVSSSRSVSVRSCSAGGSRGGGQAFPADVPAHPPQLVIGFVQPRERLALAGQVVEVAAFLGLAYLLVDQRLTT
jgi:hypothetical protein